MQIANAGDAGERHADPNVTPMIDVLLVLLITFMAAIPVQGKVVEGQLPPSDTAAVSEDVGIVLEVWPGRVYAVNREPIPGQHLGRRLAAIYAARPDKRIVVKGHPAARYQDVVTAIDIARGAGVTVVGMDTGRP